MLFPQSSTRFSPFYRYPVNLTWERTLSVFEWSPWNFAGVFYHQSIILCYSKPAIHAGDSSVDLNYPHYRLSR